MRLFLSSQDLGNYADVAFRLAGPNKKALFIKNAQDDKPPEERNFSNPEKKKMFEDVGFEFEMIDLRDYFGKPKELEKKVKQAGSFWSSGGNTFILRRAMAASGLDNILKKLLAEDKILYGGWSAGAMIMTPDLRGPDWSEEDRADIVPKGYDPEPIFDGLGMVDFYIVPHFGSTLHGNSPNELSRYYQEHKLKHYILSDGQVVLIEGEKTEVLK
jgi:dipeptidase E